MIELIMVVTIIGALASLAVPAYVSFVENARAVEALDHIAAIKKAEIAYASLGFDDSPSLSKLGMANETPLWTYVAEPQTSRIFFVINACRKNDPDNRYICLAYRLADGLTLWLGDHPGVPENYD